MKKLPLSRGRHTIVDDEDFEYLSQWKWTYHNCGYAYRNEKIGVKKYKCILLHRQILGSDSPEIDHINRDRLDNRRINLRACNRRDNAINIPKRKGKYTSKYKGVYYSRRCKAWVAQLKINYTALYLGKYKTENDAAVAYNIAASKHYGAFAYLNEVAA